MLQEKEFLNFLREICTKNNTLLLFDEVISGFRIGFEGAAGYYDIQPDLLTFGKIIGGGFPVGAYGGRREIMEKISPLGPVYQAGTLSGNPVAMNAGLAQLNECLNPGFYQSLEEKTSRLTTKLNTWAVKNQKVFKVHQIGSVFWLAFSGKDFIRRADEIDASGMELFKKLYWFLLENGIYLGPSGYEVGFVSSAHTPEMLDEAADIFIKGLENSI